MVAEFLQTYQRTLRQNPLVLPGVILLLSFLMIVTYHLTFGRNDTEFHAFLVAVVMTMVPLAYVDATICQCPHPNAIFRKFGFQVLLMHALFLSIRALSMASGYVALDTFNNWGNIIGAIGSWIALAVGYTKQLATIQRHIDVLVLVAMALAVSVATEVFGWGRMYYMMSYSRLASEWSTYLEVLAFVPGALAVIRFGKKDAKPEEIDPQEYKKNALAFGILVLGFYFIEDVVTACKAVRRNEIPFEAVAHMLHFAVLADFGVFVIGSAFDPQGARSTMLGNFGGSFFSEAV